MNDARFILPFALPVAPIRHIKTNLGKVLMSVMVAYHSRATWHWGSAASCSSNTTAIGEEL